MHLPHPFPEFVPGACKTEHLSFPAKTLNRAAKDIETDGDRDAIKEMALAGEVGLLSKGDEVELVHVDIFDGTDESAT